MSKAESSRFGDLFDETEGLRPLTEQTEGGRGMKKTYVVYTYDELAGEVQDVRTFTSKEEAEAERQKRQQQYDDQRAFKEARLREE